MRLALAFTFTSLTLAACGGDDGNVMPDARDIGFNLPTVTLKANTEVSDKNWMEIGDADFSCLNTANADVASTVAVTLNTTVNDFESHSPVPNATVDVFQNQDYMTVFQTTMSDSTAAISFNIPAGTKRFGYKMTATTAMPTFLLNQKLPMPDVATQTTKEIRTVSMATAQTLPALIGQTRTPGTGILAGALRDCNAHEVSGFIATISSASGTATTIEGSEAYYFSSGAEIPAHHVQAESSTQDGLFMIIQIPATVSTGYVQMWGFPTAADMAQGMAGLKLLSELQVPIIGDNVITGSYEPLRTP